MPAGDSNSIESSSAQAARDCEALLWGAMCSSDPDRDGGAPGDDDEAALAAVEQYLDPDCVMVNPLLHPDHSLEALSAATRPTLREALARLLLGRPTTTGRHQHQRHHQRRRRWRSWRMHKRDPAPAFAQPAMMAVQIMYRVTLVREGRRRRHHHHHHGRAEGDGDGEGGDETEGEGEAAGATLETVDAFCTSTWRQGSSGGWKLCAQQLVPLTG